MTWRIAPSARRLLRAAGAHPVVAQHQARELPGLLALLRYAHDADAALGAEPDRGGGVREVAGRAVADRVGPRAAARAPRRVRGRDRELRAVAGDVDVGRVPGRRDEADLPATVEVDDGERVLAPERHVEPPPVRADVERVGYRARARTADQADLQRLDHPVAARVDERDGVGVAVRRVDLVAARVGGDGVRVVGQQRVVRRARAGSAAARSPCACRSPRRTGPSSSSRRPCSPCG